MNITVVSQPLKPSRPTNQPEHDCPLQSFRTMSHGGNHVIPYIITSAATLLFYPWWGACLQDLSATYKLSQYCCWMLIEVPSLVLSWFGLLGIFHHYCILFDRKFFSSPNPFKQYICCTTDCRCQSVLWF